MDGLYVDDDPRDHARIHKDIHAPIYIHKEPRTVRSPYPNTEDLLMILKRVEVPSMDQCEDTVLWPDQSMRRNVVLQTKGGVVAIGPQEDPAGRMETPTVTVVKLSGSFKPAQLQHSAKVDETKTFNSMKALEKALGVEARMWITRWQVPVDRAIPAFPIYPALPKGDRFNKYSEKGVTSQVSKTASFIGPFGQIEPDLARAIGSAPSPAQIPSEVPLHPRSAKLTKSNPKAEGYYTNFLGAETISSSSHPGPFFALPGDVITTLLQCKAVKQDESASHPLGLGSNEIVASVEFNTRTGGVRMLTSSGWKFGVLRPEQLDAAGYFEKTGPISSEVDEAKVPAVWKWKDGRKLWNFKKEQPVEGEARVHEEVIGVGA